MPTKIKVTSPSGKVHTEWYDTKTGLLVKTEGTSKMMGQEVSISTTYSNYKKVGNIMLPATKNVSAGPQDITFETKDTKLNEGVTAEDFK